MPLSGPKISRSLKIQRERERKRASERRGDCLKVDDWCSQVGSLYELLRFFLAYRSISQAGERSAQRDKRLQ